MFSAVASRGTFFFPAATELIRGDHHFAKTVGRFSRPTCGMWFQVKACHLFQDPLHSGQNQPSGQPRKINQGARRFPVLKTN